jgi:hypothetical protein
MAGLLLFDIPRWITELTRGDWIGIIGVVIGIGALAYAWKQKRDAEKTIEGLQVINAQLTQESVQSRREHDDLVLKLAEISQQALNKAVARFPNNLDALRDFIAQAERELLIMADFLGYALYSNPDGFTGYIKAIQTAIEKGVEVRFLLYSLDTARTAIAKQIPQAKYLEEEIGKPRCVNFFKSLHKDPPKSYDEFRDDLLTAEQSLVERIPNAKLKVVDHSLSAFCWLQDDSTAAMFALRNDGMGEGGLTFLTVDVGMAGDFKRIFEWEWERSAKPIYKNRW